MSFLPGILTEYEIDVILFPDRGDCMIRIGIYIGIICVALLLIVLDYYRLKKRYDDLRTNHERLKNELKFLQQENYCLKRMNNID
jgi:hypothetical protein